MNDFVLDTNDRKHFWLILLHLDCNQIVAEYADVVPLGEVAADAQGHTCRDGIGG